MKDAILIALKVRFLAILIAIDELGNAILGPVPDTPAAGNPHFTISQRLAEMRTEGRRVGCIGCAILTWIQNAVFGITGDHCTNAMAGFPQDLPTDG
jgi:hypothetical protein